VSRAIQFLVLSACLWLPRSAHAEATAAPESAFISEVNLITSWKGDASIDRSVVETFKQLLRLHGYQVDDCEENTAAWQKIAARAATPNDLATYQQIDERLVAAQKCIVPSSAVRAYDVKLILDYDPELKNRRAVIHLVALGDYPSIDGGYAHKPGQSMSWYDLMNRAIERAMRHYNEPTSIRINVPSEATVGEMVQLDARGSWDPDGDGFELRWRVNVNACMGAATVLPTDRRACPAGLKKGAAPVHEQAAEQDLTREFRVPMVGDYEVGVYAKIGAREEPLRIYQLRAYPRRAWTFFAREGLLRLPKYYLSDTRQRALARMQGIGVMRRFVHRIGFMRWFEEIHYGLSVNTMQPLSTFNYEGKMTGTMFTLEIAGRVLDRTGRYGVVSTASMSVSMLDAQRGGRDRSEWGWMVSSMLGGYYALGENYVNRSTSFCQTVCPSISFGPTFATLQNTTAKKTGIVLGTEAVFGLEF
jgi:hypothetical protein